MRIFFNLATIAAALGLSTVGIAADSYILKLADVGSGLNAKDDSVVLASWRGNVDCNDGCDSDEGAAVYCKRPIRISPCACDCGNWYKNTTVFSGAEAFKSIGDTVIPPGPSAGYMNSAGFVNGLNTGLRFGESKIRAQVGGSIGVYDLKGRDTFPNRTQTETQEFLTAGVFKRSDVGQGERFSWGLVYDQLWGQNYGIFSEDIYLGQFRGIFGFALNPCNEVGVWGTAHTTSSLIQNSSVPIQAIDQYNLFWSHNYSFGGRSMLYAGLTDHSSIGSWTTGAQLLAPMSQRVSLYGNSGFLFPSAANGNNGSNEYLWSVSAGLSFSFGSKAFSRNISGQCGMPLMQVANNGTFMIGSNSGAIPGNGNDQ